MSANKTFLQKMRLAGLMLFFGNTFFLLAYAIFVAFDLFTLLQVAPYRPVVFGVLVAVMLSGFTLIFLGSRAQAVRERKGLEKSVTAAIKASGNLSATDAAFVAEQEVYVRPEGPGSRQTWILLAITLITIIGAAICLPLSIHPWGRGLYATAVALGSVSIACLVALVAGNINEDLWRFYLFGYHVHESAIGVYFALIGGPLVAFPLSNVEFFFGLTYVLCGVFLIGRDWRDVAQGKFLVHKSKEPDYAQYAALKAKRDAMPQQ